MMTTLLCCLPGPLARPHAIIPQASLVIGAVSVVLCLRAGVLLHRADSGRLNKVGPPSTASLPAYAATDEPASSNQPSDTHQACPAVQAEMNIVR